MAERIQNEYLPDVVSPPGDTLAEALEDRGITQKELAERTGLSKKTINQIIKAKAPITPETALYLERALGVPASFWNNRERRYRQYLAEDQERARLAEQVDWLRRIPVSQMVKRGWIKGCKDKVRQLREVLGFFGVSSPDAWEDIWLAPGAAYRASAVFQKDPFAVAAWLRQGERAAQEIVCERYDQAAFRQALSEARRMTLDEPDTWALGLKKLFAPCGVAVVLIPELPRIRVSGAARWVSPVKALIQLNLRYKSDDRLWFTFFHEAGHIVLHGKRAVFVDDEHDDSPAEREADRFAEDFLIPRSEYRRFVAAGCLTKGAIRAFARQLGIAPGIVVGRLQHEGRIEWDRYNDLKRRLEWAPTA